ncbi:MAG: helix-turn-helix transcriptional regulator [Lachnospiraceae bacterium]|nr:helix-turn-helix transcriptional regulator [Lachnospiraceae bacterium]
MEFNNKLYNLRKQKGLSQEELAGRLNVSRQTVSKWEVGESTPDLEKLAAISELFEVSLDELVLDKKPKQQEAVTEQIVRSELYSDIKENVLTDDNKKKVKKWIKIVAIVFGIMLAIDMISLIVAAIVYGLPQ